MIRRTQGKTNPASTPCGNAAAQSLSRFRAPVVVLALFVGSGLLAGCSSGGGTSASTRAGSWFSGLGAKEDSRVLYTKRDGIEVRTKADSSSPSVARLGAGEKVVRKSTSGAWAWVEARGGKVKGWVPASQLASRPAASGSKAAGTAAGSNDNAADAADASVESAPAESGQPTAESAQNVANDVAKDVAQDVAQDVAKDAPAPEAPPAPRPAAPKAQPVKKGQVAPSVFDPY